MNQQITNNGLGGTKNAEEKMIAESRGRSRTKDHRDDDRKNTVKKDNGSNSPSRSRDRSHSPKKDHHRSGSKGKRSKSPKKGNKKKYHEKGPSDWTREELIEKLKKFATLTIDRNTGSGALEIRDYHIMNEAIKVIVEALSRFTEIQHFTVTDCYITDDTCTIICDGLKNMRHLKALCLTDNSLTKSSVRYIIKTFSKNTRRLETLDLRNNNTTTEDGIALYEGFSDIKVLNGVKLRDIKTVKDVPVVDLKDMKLRSCEVAILCEALAVAPHVTTIDISRNTIDAKGAEYLANRIPVLNRLSSIDISYNPLTNDDRNFTGLEALMKALRNTNNVCNLQLTGCGRLPPRTETKIRHSLHVNRCINHSVSGTAFEDFIYNAVSSTAPPIRENPLKDWKPNFTIDIAFAEKNKIEEKTVEVQGDEIILGSRKRF
jgi:hypothetical protein